MFIHNNDAFFSEKRFERVHIVDCNGNSSVYYPKEGLYLKFLHEHYYAVYNDEMQLMGTINHLFPFHVLLVSANFPLNVN